MTIPVSTTARIEAKRVNDRLTRHYVQKRMNTAVQTNNEYYELERRIILLESSPPGPRDFLLPINKSLLPKGILSLLILLKVLFEYV